MACMVHTLYLVHPGFWYRVLDVIAEPIAHSLSLFFYFFPVPICRITKIAVAVEDTSYKVQTRLGRLTMIGFIVIFIPCHCIWFTYSAGSDCPDCGYALHLFFRHMIFVQMDMYVYSVWHALFSYLYMRWLTYHIVIISFEYLSYLWCLIRQGWAVP